METSSGQQRSINILNVIDTAAKVATAFVPIVLLHLGHRFTSQQDLANAAQRRADRAAVLLKHLASSEVRERLLAVSVMQSLAKQEQFPPDLATALVQIASTDTSIDVVRVASGAVDTAVQTDRQAAPIFQQLNTALPARVYFHIRREEQREAAKAVQNAIETHGLVVPGIERVTTGPDRDELRFFKQEDRGEAERIAERLRGAGVQVIVTDLSPNFQDSERIRPRHFELWLRPPPLL